MDQNAVLNTPKNCRPVAFLSNYEVYTFFKEKKEDGLKSAKQAQKLKYNTHLNTVLYEALQFLQDTPCAVQNEHCVEMFMELVQPFNLTKAEKLAILNSRPTQPVDIQSIVDESEERLTVEQMNDLVSIVLKTLPPVKSDEDDTMEQDNDYEMTDVGNS